MMQSPPITKYRPSPTIHLPDRQWPNRVIDKAPIWCSVDLRDGNQALAIPMNVDEKVELFQTLVRIGFKQIEVGFPSASDTEYEFLRRLADDHLVPGDVIVQVLVQAREHLIRRTFESLQGIKQAIVHLYNSTNPLQRRVTFGMDKTQIKNIAIEGTKLVKSLVAEVPDTKIYFQYSPESFSDTEVEYALEVCEAVMDVWEPTAEEKIILNLPATVEISTPNVYADQIEWFCRHMKRRELAIISLHTHNDRGTGVAATELGLMAGADRVEGTLFGNGERTGNLDIVTVALNMYSQGVHPGLDFSNLNEIREIYHRTTRMTVHERHPYGGELVFTAFSGSHQDAIKKGMDKMDKSNGALWQVPYLPIDPRDIGRTYKAIIRINSQSGKGGVAFVLENEYGIEIPKRMHPDVGQFINRMADRLGKELSPKEIYDAFMAEYVNRTDILKLLHFDVIAKSDEEHLQTCRAEILFHGEKRVIEGTSNGPIAAFCDALERIGEKDFIILDFRQHALTLGATADAIAYLQIERTGDKRHFFGAGTDTDIEMAGLKSLVSAYNRAHLA